MTQLFAEGSIHNPITVKRRQGRRREAGSERSLSHSHDLTNRNRIEGIGRRVSWRTTVKPEVSKGGPV